MLPDGRYIGKIKNFNAEKGFGFIDCPATRDKWKRDVFIHKQQMGDMDVGVEVTFFVEANKEGMPQAREIERRDGLPTGAEGKGKKGKGKGRGKKRRDDDNGGGDAGEGGDSGTGGDGGDDNQRDSKGSKGKGKGKGKGGKGKDKGGKGDDKGGKKGGKGKGGSKGGGKDKGGGKGGKKGKPAPMVVPPPPHLAGMPGGQDFTPLPEGF